MRQRPSIALLGAALLAACGGGMQAPSVGPNDIPSLEAAVNADPDDVDRLTLLGVAYYNAGRHDDAAATLERAVATGEAEPIAHLHLGLAHEARGEWQAASDAYAAFLAEAPADSDVRDDVESRITLVERELMQAQLAAMLEQEAILASQPALPRTVAVFPFRVVADDPRYEPLQYALADMVTTDLGIPGALQMLERAQVQALVQEMALTLAGVADASNAARVGRLMRAERVVQGSVVVLGEDRLRMEMAVVDPSDAEREGEASDETALEQIFDAEKQLVVQLLAAMGVTLTASEREAIEENRTGSLLALLAYGEGLAAMDRGDFGAAAASFRQATDIDPGFQAAQARAEEATSAQQAAETSGAELAAVAQSELPTPEAVAPVAILDEIVEETVSNAADQHNQDGDGDIDGVVENISPGEPIDDSNSNAGGTSDGIRIPIVIDNPNVE